MIKLDVADMDVIYLTYQEPQKEEFWVKISNMIPWATRVDGVKGSDAAHKAAAAASTTDRFILIDGDNMPDLEFFNLVLDVPDDMEDCVFRWKARNRINGLQYCNGGLSCWTKDFVNNMRTHEASDGSDDTSVEFCFDPKYIAMHDTYSTTYPNYSPKQAWMAGFREGVKMCLDKGRRPTLAEFEKAVHKRNYDNLCIWMSIGADVRNGNYARLGAMQGTMFTMLGYGDDPWDYKQVQDFDALEQIWLENYVFTGRDEVKMDGLSNTLRKRLGLPIVSMGAEQSAFFKSHMLKHHRNLGPMVTEMNVIRGIEGW